MKIRFGSQVLGLGFLFLFLAANTGSASEFVFGDYLLVSRNAGRFIVAAQDGQVIQVLPSRALISYDASSSKLAILRDFKTLEIHHRPTLDEPTRFDLSRQVESVIDPDSIHDLVLFPGGHLIGIQYRSKEGLPHLLVMDLRTGQSLYDLANVSRPVFSSDVKLLFSCRECSPRNSTSGNVDVYDATNGELKFSLSVQGDHIDEDRLFVSADGHFLVAECNYSIHVWDLRSKTLHMSVPFSGGISLNVVGFVGDGRILYSTTSGIQLLDLNKKAFSPVFEGDCNHGLFNKQRDQLVCVGGGKAIFWTLPEMVKTHALNNGEEIIGFEIAADDAAISPSGTFLLSQNKIWDVPNRTLLYGYEPLLNSAIVGTGALSGDNRRMALWENLHGDADANTRADMRYLIEVGQIEPDYRQIQRLRTRYRTKSALLNFDGSRLYAKVSHARDKFEVFNVVSGLRDEALSHRLSSSPVTDVLCISPNGNALVRSSDTEFLQIYDLETVTPKMTLPVNFYALKDPDIRRKKYNSIPQCGFESDQTVWLKVGVGDDYQIAVWDVESQKELLKISYGFGALHKSPGVPYAASCKNGVVSVLNLRVGKVEHSHLFPCGKFDVSSDGRWLTALRGNTVTLWNAGNSAPAATFNAPRLVDTIVFRSQGLDIISCELPPLNERMSDPLKYDAYFQAFDLSNSQWKQVYGAEIEHHPFWDAYFYRNDTYKDPFLLPAHKGFLYPAEARFDGSRWFEAVELDRTGALQIHKLTRTY